jgi:hypothetical protein
VAGSWEYYNELWSSIKGGEFICQIIDFEFPTKDSTPYSYLVVLTKHDSAHCLNFIRNVLEMLIPCESPVTTTWHVILLQTSEESCQCTE